MLPKIVPSPLFEAYRLLSAAPRSARVEQVLTLLRIEIESDGSLIYEDPSTGELRLSEGLRAPERSRDARRATRGAVLTFRKRR